MGFQSIKGCSAVLYIVYCVDLEKGHVFHCICKDHELMMPHVTGKEQVIPRCTWLECKSKFLPKVGRNNC